MLIDSIQSGLAARPRQPEKIPVVLFGMAHLGFIRNFDRVIRMLAEDQIKVVILPSGLPKQNCN